MEILKLYNHTYFRRPKDQSEYSKSTFFSKIETSRTFKFIRKFDKNQKTTFLRETLKTPRFMNERNV